MPGDRGALPIGSLGELAVAHHDEYPRWESIHPSPKRHSARDRKPVAQRAGICLNPRQLVHVGVAGDGASELSVSVQHLRRKETHESENRVLGHSFVTGREQESIAASLGRARRVDDKFVHVEGRDDVDRGQGTAKMTAVPGLHHAEHQTSGLGRTESQFVRTGAHRGSLDSYS